MLFNWFIRGNKGNLDSMFEFVLDREIKLTMSKRGNLVAIRLKPEGNMKS